MPRFKKASEGSDHHVHWPLVSRLKLREQGGPTTMWLGQVGAVVPGMMRVVVDQPHFLEGERIRKNKNVASVWNKRFIDNADQTSKNSWISRPPAFFPLTQLLLFSPALIFKFPRISPRQTNVATTVNLWLSQSDLSDTARQPSFANECDDKEKWLD